MPAGRPPRTEEQKKAEEGKKLALQLINNPLMFAEHFLRDPNKTDKKFKARWLQRDMLSQREFRLNTVRAQRGSGKTISLVGRILWYAYTHSNGRILCIGPYKLTVQRIFEEINKQIDASPELHASVKRRISNPFQIELNNGCIIRGLSTNVTSKKGGQAVRGEHPDFIYIDEADYLEDDDWQSFVSLFTPTEIDVDPPEVWATTTPTGKRSFFYELCEHKGERQKGTDWKDWWFPARHIAGVTFKGGAEHTFNVHGFPVPTHKEDILCTAVNESWTKAQDDSQWGMLGEQGYYHEITAWWGDSTASVFPKRLVDSAKKLARKHKHSYITAREQGSGGFFTAGIDVDEMSATPNICIVEYIPPIQGSEGIGNGLYVMRNRYCMPRSDTIYTDLERELITQNIRFRFEKAYVDKQPGAQTVERLKLSGHHNFEAKQFKENVMVPTADANGNLMLDAQPLKHAMIFVLRRLFEQGRISLPPLSNEETDLGDYTPFGEEVHKKDVLWDEDLEKTIRNYQIVNVSKTGSPEYTGTADHPLMAMLMGIFAAYTLFDNPFSITLPSEIIVSKSADVPMMSGELPQPEVSKSYQTEQPATQYVAGFAQEFRIRENMGRSDFGSVGISDRVSTITRRGSF